MTDLPTDLHDLARLLVTLPGWEWRPGMRDTQGAVYCSTDPETGEEVWAEPPHLHTGDIGWRAAYLWPEFTHKRVLPDLTCPATLGALLGLVRELAGDMMLCVQPVYVEPGIPAIPGEPWVVYTCGDPPGSGPTEAHALVAALAALEDSDGKP